MTEYVFEYLICDDEILSVDEAEDEYGIRGMEEYCSDIVLRVVVYGAKTWKEAKQKMLEYMKQILEKEAGRLQNVK